MTGRAGHSIAACEWHLSQLDLRVAVLKAPMKEQVHPDLDTLLGIDDLEGFPGVEGTGIYAVNAKVKQILTTVIGSRRIEVRMGSQSRGVSTS